MTPELEKLLAEKDETIKTLEQKYSSLKMWEWKIGAYDSQQEVLQDYQNGYQQKCNDNVTLQYKLDKLNDRWKIVAYDLQQEVASLKNKIKQQEDIFQEEKKQWPQQVKECAQCNPSERRIVSTWDNRYRGDETFKENND